MRRLACPRGGMDQAYVRRTRMSRGEMRAYTCRPESRAGAAPEQKEGYVRTVESMQAILERQFIKGLVLGISRASSDAERQRHIDTLTDLVRHGDPTLDPTQFDAWTSSCLSRLGLHVWSNTEPSRSTVGPRRARPSRVSGPSDDACTHERN